MYTPNPFTPTPKLENNSVLLLPLIASDFDVLFAVASDPKIWEQHPQSDRWKEDIFRRFFEGAMQSQSAFKIIDKDTDTLAGSTRFYDYDSQNRSIFIGYTFYAVRYWGTGFNTAVKRLMLVYAFHYVDTVYFQVGSTNFRSQKAVERLGARKVAETLADYHGNGGEPNFTYELKRLSSMA